MQSDNDDGYPKKLWGISLPNSGSLTAKRGLRVGNGIVVSKDDEMLWLVSDDGYLYVVQALTGEIEYEVEPPEFDGVDEYFVESRSAVGLVYDEGFDDEKPVLGVYTTIELHVNDNTARSRFIAVDRYGQLQWHMVLDGVAQGTPRISGDGKYAYILTNEEMSENVQNPLLRGLLYVVDLNSQEFTVVKHSAGFPFTAAAEITDDDELYFADSWRFGYSRGGGVLYRAQITGTSNATSPEVSISTIIELSGSSAVKPSISKNGSNLIVGGSASKIEGVRKRNDGNFIKRFKLGLRKNDQNVTAPLLASAVFEKDGDAAFIISWNSQLYKVDVDNKSVDQKTNLDDSTLPSHSFVSPLLSVDEETLYVVKHRLGDLIAVDTSDLSSVEWRKNCDDWSDFDDCEDSVEADPILSNSGEILYYANVFGEVLAIQMKPLS